MDTISSKLGFALHELYTLPCQQQDLAGFWHQRLEIFLRATDSAAGLIALPGLNAAGNYAKNCQAEEFQVIAEIGNRMLPLSLKTMSQDSLLCINSFNPQPYQLIPATAQTPHTILIALGNTKNPTVLLALSGRLQGYNATFFERFSLLFEACANQTVNSSPITDAPFQQAFLFDPTPKALVSAQGKCHRANHAFCALTGYSAETLEGMPLDSLLPEATHPFPTEEHHLLHQNGSPIRVRVDWLGELGQTAAAAPQDGDVWRVVQIQDLTGQIQIEQVMYENVTRFRRAFNDAAIGMALVSPDGIFLEVNACLCQMLGYANQDLVGKHYQDITYEEDLHLGPPILATLLSGQKDRYHFEKRYWHRDGHVVWIDLTASLIRDSQGNALYCVSQFQDITSRKMMEETLRTNEEYFRCAFDNAAIGMALVSPKSAYIKVNPKLCAITGYSQEELTTKTLEDITHPDDIEEDLNYIRQMLALEVENYSREKRYIHKNGNQVWVYITASPVFIPSRDILYFVVQMQDITERKRIEQALLDSEENFRRAFDDAAIGMALVTLNGQFLKVNNKLTEITGYNKYELLNTNFQNITYPEDRERDASFWQRMLNGELTTCEYEKRYIHKEGYLAWILLTGSMVMDEEGRLLYYVAQMQDITERKRVEQALRDSEERFRSAFNYASTGMALISADGRWLKVNRMISRITGYSEEELLTLDFQSITHPDDLQTDLKLLQRLLNREIETYQLEKRYIHRNGHTVWIQLNVSPVCSEDGGIAYLISQIQDITDRKLAEVQLRKAKEEAEVAASTKADFLATMSHEIRTPLNAVLGMATLLETTPLTEEQQDLVQTIKNGGKTLLAIINDILDFSKIESGKMELDHHPFEMKTCIEEVFSLFLQKAKSQGIALFLQMAEDVPPVINGDSTRLRQVLVNLIGNAFKFTETGEITVTILLNPGSNTDGSLELLFQVQDTGCGIPHDKLQVIFDSFTQVGPAISRKYGGTGLGLAICNRLVQLMGGRIWAESQVNQGSTFQFTAQFSPMSWDTVKTTLPDMPYRFDEQLALLYPLNLLVAEDNPVNQKLIIRLLEKMGYKPRLTQNGHEVLQALNENLYDLIFMDIQMPDMDGLEATRQIIQHYGEQKRPRIVAMTAFGLEDDRSNFLASGMDDYISKPISAPQLEQMIKHWHQWLKQQSNSRFSSVDEVSLLERFAHDTETLREMIVLFEEDCIRLLSCIQDGLTRQDTQSIKRCAHELKGACLAVGAMSMKEMAGKLEKQAKLQQFEAMQNVANLLEAKAQIVRLELEQLAEELPTTSTTV